MKFFVYYNKKIKKAEERAKKISIKSVKNIKEADFLLIIGGDGSVLKFVPEIVKYNKPVIYYKSGEVSALPGFKVLTKKMLKNIDKFKMKSFPVLKATSKNRELFALNDIVLKGSNPARLFKYRLKFKNKNLKISGDGVLFSTSIGSTAYNLALGGPVVEPSLNVIIINPIASFNSENKVFVLGEKEKVKGKIENSNFDVFLFADGQRSIKLKEKDEFEIKLDKEINFIVP